jgi:hypothetical protein
MWIVLRSDAKQSIWPGRRDALHYLSVVGVTAAFSRHKYDVVLPDGQHITAQVVRG